MLEDLGDGIIAGAFDFNERAQLSDFVEGNFAVAEKPAGTVFFDNEDELQSEGLKKLLGGVEITDGQFNFFALFVGSALAGSFKAHDRLGLFGTRRLPDAQAGIVAQEAPVRLIEEMIALQNSAPWFGLEFLKALGVEVQPINFDFGFNFKAHSHDCIEQSGVVN